MHNALTLVLCLVFQPDGICTPLFATADAAWCLDDWPDGQTLFASDAAQGQADNTTFPQPAPPGGASSLEGEIKNFLDIKSRHTGFDRRP